ncbi:MAG: hypothetical protein FWD36_03820 [Treponema sp.]|nr:hypothetical protein [Treponema sp.]
MSGRNNILFLAAIAALMVSCHLFDDYSVDDTVALFFNETNVSVFEGGMASVSLRVEPTTVLEGNNVLYSISNEDVAVIYRADKRGCVFIGRSEGAAVLTARLKEAEAKMVITVLKN